MPTTLIDWEETWNYTTFSTEGATLPDGWYLPNFDDSGWSSGQAMIGNLSPFPPATFETFINGLGGINTTTDANTADGSGGVILIRKSVTMVGTGTLTFSARSDNYCRVYVNGVNVFTPRRWQVGYVGIPSDPKSTFALTGNETDGYDFEPATYEGGWTYANGTTLVVAAGVWNLDTGVDNNPILIDVKVVAT